MPAAARRLHIVRLRGLNPAESRARALYLDQWKKDNPNKQVDDAVLKKATEIGAGAAATSLATTGPEITGVTMHSVPGWVGDDHCITAEIEGVKAVVDICSSTSAIAGWSVVALLRNLASPICFY